MSVAKTAAENDALIKQASDVAYELGSVVAYVKFASDYLTDDWKNAMLSRLTPAHVELYKSFQEVGGRAG